MGEQTVKIPTMWNIKQAAEKTGLSRFTISQLIKSEKIKHIRLGVGKRGKILLNAQSLCDYMQGGVGMKNVLDFIPLGRNHAIPMNDLAMRMGVSQRTARKLVFEARNNGAVICSTCSGDKSAGYYRPIASAEIALRPVKEFVEGETHV